MKRIIVFVILLMVPIFALCETNNISDRYWSINFSLWEDSPPWYNTDGVWKFFKTIKFNDGYIVNRNNKIIGRYWMSHPTNLNIKIDGFKIKFYGSFRYMKNSSILCGTGERWGEGLRLKMVKIILVRKEKS